MTDQQLNPDLIHDILGVLNRHGYARADDEHVGRAILLIGDLAHIYEGAQDHPFGPYRNEPSPPRPEAAPGPAAQGAVTVPAGEIKSLLAALDIAADYKRDRTADCADCTNESCPTCQSSPKRPDLRPPRRSPDPGHRGIGHRYRQPARARSRPGGRPVTRNRSASARQLAA